SAAAGPRSRTRCSPSTRRRARPSARTCGSNCPGTSCGAGAPRAWTGRGASSSSTPGRAGTTPAGGGWRGRRGAAARCAAAARVDRQGRLVVVDTGQGRDDSGGGELAVAAGDVTHLRGADGGLGG